MATMQDYALLSVFVNQSKQIQMTSARISWESGQQSIDLLGEGLGGFSPGSGRCNISGGFVVPIGGLETDFTEILVEGQFAILQIPIGAKTYAGQGKFISMEISQDANAPIAGTFEWEGEIAALV